MPHRDRKVPAEGSKMHHRDRNIPVEVPRNYRDRNIPAEVPRHEHTFRGSKTHHRDSNIPAEVPRHITETGTYLQRFQDTSRKQEHTCRGSKTHHGNRNVPAGAGWPQPAWVPGCGSCRSPVRPQQWWPPCLVEVPHPLLKLWTYSKARFSHPCTLIS